MQWYNTRGVTATKKAGEIIVMVEFVIALGVTPYFGIAAQALDDAESMT